MVMIRLIIVESCDKCPVGSFDKVNVIYHCHAKKLFTDDPNYGTEFRTCKEVSDGDGIPLECPLTKLRDLGRTHWE